MIEEVIISIGVVGLICATIVLAIWISAKAKINATNKKTELIINLIEKNPNIDIKDIISQKPKMDLTRRLLLWLRVGISFLIIGIGLLLFISMSSFTYVESTNTFIIIAIVLIGFGIGMLTSYFIGKQKFYKKENELK